MSEWWHKVARPWSINPLYRIMQEQQIVFIIIITHYLLICQVNKL